MRKHTELDRLAVNRAGAGALLQDFLATHFGLSRRKAKDIIDSRTVFVNRKRVWMARHKLEEGDIVEIQKRAPVETTGKKPLIRIIYRDELILVVDKPAGVLTNGDDSFEERMRLQLKMPELLAVHRLDRDTSGCLLVATNRDAFDTLIRVFKEQKIHKQYHAIVTGEVSPPERTIRIPLEGMPAITHVKTLCIGNDASHVLVSIETGRTHQIRKHLSAIGNPVFGDSHYGTAKPASDTSMRVSRQMLHASAINLMHPLSGKPVRASSRLPDDFTATLRMLQLV